MNKNEPPGLVVETGRGESGVPGKIQNQILGYRDRIQGTEGSPRFDGFVNVHEAITLNALCHAAKVKSKNPARGEIIRQGRTTSV
jgi:hypothetical protein